MSTTTGPDRTATGAPGGADRHQRLLDSGAILAPGTLPGAGGPDSAADVLTARGYAHPALDGRRIVRLVPGALGPAEDLAVDFLGLVPAEEPVEVGQVRQEALGFPAWALVHDPANGHHALALVKEMERLARQAKSKPGHAKDGFDELAGRLGRAVPHFLPTFCEQVGRIFLEQENQTYASTFFGRAREAERTHSLPVDEERLRAVFLEFALAGALTVKALRQYVKELSGRLDPLTAWQRFRQLCTERSAAGMAPYAGVAEDARTLLKAAGLDRDEHERGLLLELLASPAVNRAPGTFWKSWHEAVVELGRGDAAVRARLLELMPDPPGNDDRTRQDAGWLAVLAESGAERLLTDLPADLADLADGAAAAEPAAAWLQRWTNHLGRGWRTQGLSTETVALAGRMFDRLRAEGVPVDLFTGVRRSATQLELLDLLLAEGVPVADPAEGHSFHLQDWVGASDPDGRTLAAIAADPRFRSALRAAVPPVWDTVDSRRLAARPVLRELFVEWSDARADELAAARGLESASGILHQLSAHRTGIRDENPAAARRIADLDVTGLLADTLRGGILDELGWPALEEALVRLGVEAGDTPGVGSGRNLPEGLLLEEAWPNLVLARGHQVVVAGPQGIVLEHTLRIPDKLDTWHRPRFRFVDGELLVAWAHEGKQRAYWSGRPADTFELGGERIAHYYGGGDIETPTLPLPGGGRTGGHRPLHVGDTVLPAEGRVLGDGTGHWRAHRSAGVAVLEEIDPATGTVGRASEPPRIAANAAAGSLDLRRSQLLPFQPGLEDTPLGTDGTVLGSWLRKDGTRVTTVTADGTTLVVDNTRSSHLLHPLGRLALPGGGHPVVQDGNGRQLALGLPTADSPAEGTVAADPTGFTADFEPGRPGGLAAAGTALVLPLAHWHVLRPRDERGSTELRAVDRELAARLVDAAWPADAEPVPAAQQRWITVQGVRRPVVSSGKAEERLPVDAVAGVLPGVTHRLLLAGVTGLARTAADLLDRVARYVPQPEDDGRTAGGSAATGYAHRPEHGTDYELGQAVSLLLPGVGGFGRSWERGPEYRVLNNLRAVTAVLAEPPAAEGDGWSTRHRIELHGDDNHHGWLQVLGRLGTLAYAAAAPLTSAEQRHSLGLLLTELTAGLLADRGDTLREVVLTEPLTDPNAPKGKHERRAGQVWRHGDRTVVVLGCSHHHEDKAHWLAVDHDPSGAFGAVAHFGTAQERRTEETVDAAWVARFTGLLREHGATTHRADRAADFGARTGIGAVRSTLLFSPTEALIHWYGAPLPPEALKEYGLKSGESKAARDWLRGCEREVLGEVWAALLPADPEELWSIGPDSAAGAAHWTARLGRLVTLPEAEQATVSGTRIQKVEEILNHATTPWLSRTTRQRVLPLGESATPVLQADDPLAVLDYSTLSEAADAIAWLAYRLPWNSPLRASLGPAVQALRTRLADPGLLLAYDLRRNSKGEPLSPVLRARYGLPAEGGADADGLVRVGEALVLSPGHDEAEQIWWRPAGLDGPQDQALDQLAGLGDSYWLARQRTVLTALLDGELDRLVALPELPDATGTAGAVGAAGAAGAPAEGAEVWPHHPLLTVPELVTEVAKTHELGEDAAVLYLQLLALPDPTDRNVARWTGWKPARLKKARAELLASGLVMEAKRARAGRTLFLPGGWQEAKAPGLPVETWKAALYDLPTHHDVLPRSAVPELFARAWQRVTDGDAPGFEELRTGKRRKARR
ncbi:hypothetical protein SAMN05216371_2078 [Streptomyces sp. TLI_053]|uniref:hypothetical protein n=1 Tax=Streptomyces sp. TLI_053 TaxID=1855352 RepID=UPI0008793C49|nr:hypothetical protein [Streptomyces sp. TLI_053]SDT37723.1 hypothetical protein SAMN05216371_2078 [Streptomyces sp. TLI_053]